ncbi:MAG: hypothetical protein O3A95_07885 [Planctomycetota bacterium]|nr:hypothetical protein [Planctomycetota bacterium]MDA1114202.1 hypothetical protein [Planctomycetota bacterium]
MGAGKNVAIGCGGLLVLMVLALYLGFQWANKNFGFSQDPELALSRASEVMNVQIPDGFEPIFSTYTRKGKQDPMAIFIAQASRTHETALILYQRTGAYTEEEMFAEIANEGSGMNVSVGLEGVGKDERFPVQYLGKEYQAMLKEGLDEDQQMVRILLTVIPEEEHTLLILFSGDPEIIRRDLLQTVLDSGLKADTILTTPRTDEGKMLETDQ